MQDVSELGVAVSRHRRLGFQFWIAEPNSLLNLEPLVSVRGDVHDADLSGWGRRGRFKEGKEVVREKRVAQVIGLFGQSVSRLQHSNLWSRAMPSTYLKLDHEVVSREWRRDAHDSGVIDRSV